jgi:hypothetical protein
MERGRIIGRAAVLVAALALPLIGAFTAMRAWRGQAASQPVQTTRADSLAVPIPTGRHLVAFVFLSSECGACTFEETERAIRRLRASLRTSHAETFARIAVVGVTIDGDLRAGTNYVRRLNRSGQVFDELSVGGVWMNQLVTQRVWREGVALPAVPQVLLVGRHVDASEYPRMVDVRRDSILFRVVGREDLVAWVDRGTPLFSWGDAGTVTRGTPSAAR